MVRRHVDGVRLRQCKSSANPPAIASGMSGSGGSLVVLDENEFSSHLSDDDDEPSDTENTIGAPRYQQKNNTNAQNSPLSEPLNSTACSVTLASVQVLHMLGHRTLWTLKLCAVLFVCLAVCLYNLASHDVLAIQQVVCISIIAVLFYWIRCRPAAAHTDVVVVTGAMGWLLYSAMVTTTRRVVSNYGMWAVLRDLSIMVIVLLYGLRYWMLMQGNIGMRKEFGSKPRWAWLYTAHVMLTYPIPAVWWLGVQPTVPYRPQPMAVEHKTRTPLSVAGSVVVSIAFDALYCALIPLLATPVLNCSLFEVQWWVTVLRCTCLALVYMVSDTVMQPTNFARAHAAPSLFVVTQYVWFISPWMLLFTLWHVLLYAVWSALRYRMQQQHQHHSPLKDQQYMAEPSTVLHHEYNEEF